MTRIAPVPPSANPAAASGREADSPWAIPAKGWKQVAIRTWNESGADNIGLVSAGVAFYCFLAMVPLLGALVMSYGLVADVATVVENVKTLASVMPSEAAALIGEQLLNVVTASDGKKGLGLVLALAVSLYGGMNAASAIVMALNIAYEEVETRSLLQFYLRALAMTVLVLVCILAAIVSLAAIAHLGWLVSGLPDAVLVLGRIVYYALVMAAGAAAAASLYRYAPDRQHARWAWLTPGSLLAAALWVVASLGFGAYVAGIGNYDATYGSLGAVVVLLTWLYLSAYALLLGAELNAELEHQTARDSTDGPALPLGERGAVMADTVAGDPVQDPLPRHSVQLAAPAAMPRVVRPSLRKDFAVSRITSRTGRVAGAPRVTVAPSVLATIGLMMLRRPGRALIGIALLASGGGLAWLSRETTRAGAK